MSKGGGEIKKRAFKLSPLGPVSVIADGVLNTAHHVSKHSQSTSTCKHTHTHTQTHLDAWMGKQYRSRKNCSGVCKSVFVVSLLSNWLA